MTSTFLDCLSLEEVPVLYGEEAFFDRPLTIDKTLLHAGPKIMFLPGRPSIKHVSVAPAGRTRWFRTMLAALSHPNLWGPFMSAYLEHVEALEGVGARAQLEQ